MDLDVPMTEGIHEAEAAWAGSVADFGETEAGYFVQSLPGYGDYRGTLEDKLRSQFGEAFPMWRAMTQDAFTDWANGADIGPVGFTFSEDFAKAWKDFAPLLGKPLVVVRVMIRPEWVIMRGKIEELELVIDGNQISFDTLEVA